jgi:hypothetical protein
MPSKLMNEKPQKRSKQIADAGVRNDADRLGIDARVLGRAIGRYPALRSKLDDLARNAAVFARILGVNRTKFIHMDLVGPELIDLPLAKLAANIREGSRYLSVSAERFKQLGLRAPVLPTLSPQEWESRVGRLARALNCGAERIRRQIIRVPEIIGWPLDRWRAKRREIATALGFDTRQMNLMIIRYPNIINSRPATLKMHMKRLNKLLPLSRADAKAG